MGTEGNVIRNQNKRRIMIFSIFTLIFLGLLGTAYIRSREDNILLLLMLTPALGKHIEMLTISGGMIYQSASVGISNSSRGVKVLSVNLKLLWKSFLFMDTTVPDPAEGVVRIRKAPNNTLFGE